MVAEVVAWALLGLALAVCAVLAVALRKRRAIPTEPDAETIEDEGQQYRVMALYQRKLARYARRDGHPDLAEAQDAVADTYDELARVYDESHNSTRDPNT